MDPASMSNAAQDQQWMVVLDEMCSRSSSKKVFEWKFIREFASSYKHCLCTKSSEMWQT